MIGYRFANMKKTGRQVLRAGLAALIVAVLVLPGQVQAAPKVKPPQKIPAIIVGDRVVDIAFNLGVMPAAMSVRGSLWPMAGKLKQISQILGCPRCVTVKDKKAVPNALDKMKLRRVIIEKSPQFCLYMPKVKPENVVPLLEGREVTIEYVDFSQGLESAIRQTAKLLGREDKAQEVIEEYNKESAEVKALLPKEKSGKKALIISGTYQADTGRSILRVEAPGYYADRYLLGPLGWVNAGEAFNPDGGKPSKGHYIVRKSKKGLDLSPLLKADPDAIIMTGDAFAVQQALADFAASNPDLAKVKAVASMAVYALPGYVDSSVLEYPSVLRKWSAALAR